MSVDKFRHGLEVEAIGKYNSKFRAGAHSDPLTIFRRRWVQSSDREWSYPRKK